MLYIHISAGGFVAETRTWAYLRRFGVIGIFNALNGVLVLFSNPHVAGVTQAMLAQVRRRIGHHCCTIIIMFAATSLVPVVCAVCAVYAARGRVAQPRHP